MSDDPSPVRVLGLDHVVLRCLDLERAIAFYRDVLGCTLERTLPDIGLYQMRAGASLIDLVPVGSRLGGETPPDPARANMAHVCVRIEAPEWDAVRAHLARHGVACPEPGRRYGADGHGLSVYVEDPDGNVVELKGPPEDGDILDR